MAQFVMEDMVRKAGLDDVIQCESAATSTEEIGNPPHYGTVQKMKEMGIPMRRHFATRMTKSDYKKYDYIIVFEERNKRDLINIIGDDVDNKVHLILEYTDSLKDIDDPWYTDDFDTAFEEINKGCFGLFNYLVEKGNKDEI
jgi:protein-tyrosine phosphatase